MKRATRAATTKNGDSHRRETPDPFRFGWRYVQQLGADGRKVRVRVPLTLDDVLHPQEGDHIPENSQQEQDCTYLASVLRYRLAGNPHTVVFRDCLINWGVRGLRNHSPDISVFDEVLDLKRIWRTFYVAKEKARPVLALEVVSPDSHAKQARDNDVVTKVREYFRAGVPLYVVVDQERVDGPRRLLAYGRGSKHFEPLPLDERGRVFLESLGLRLGLREERVVCWDAATDEEIGDLTQAMHELHKTEAARHAEAQARREAETALAAALKRLHELEAREKHGE